MKRAKMILAVTDADGWREANLFYSPQDFRKRTRNFEIISKIEMVISGKTYAERKESLRQLAISVQQLTYDPAFLDAVWWLEAELREYFVTNGLRFGLIEEFRENAII